ncbi:peptidoglycan DD-metalloendopeptidase family protein [Neiella marina]|uniref:Peptidoglycan DD-metalloendopeptidase family protein n=2 Tax=Neiella holothuriorum TaxID=2870530 RepID=A0ABS7EB39_9GAMM|nr:peptidoglycan DD-metalloendopeptidase family protein [Neiella holothuriorum]
MALLIMPWWLAPHLISSTHFEQQVQQAQTENLQQRDTLMTLRLQLHGQLIEMAEHIGTLQAKSSQLDRLSEMLVQKSEIDQQEFDIATTTSQQSMEAAGGPFAAAPATNTESLTEMLVELDELIESYDDKQRQLELLAVLMQQQDAEDASWLSGRPIGEGWLSSGFGARIDPFTGKKASHWGVDFAGHAGSNVHTTAAGVVTWAGRRWGYGNLVEVSHGGGYTTRYGHNSEIHVAVGDVVTKGDVIAAMGSTGRSTGPHVHYEVLKNGKQVDPSPFIFR